MPLSVSNHARYDSLNRLISASGSGDPQGSWSQTFSYDGFGNLTSKIGNNAPNVTSWTVNPATNQVTSNGATYDANGNMSAYGSPGQVTNFQHDEANRLSQVTPPGTPSNNTTGVYSYDAANQRIYASISTTVNSVYTTNNYIYFYGADGKKLGVWQLTSSNNVYTLTLQSTNIWFGGRLIQRNGVSIYQDRLQSVGKYFPYGEDRNNPNPANPSNDQQKFATYTRDSISGLDYAMNRYYSAGVGRFMSADPFAASMSRAVPQSLNRYAYAQNDPANRSDPNGLCDVYIAGITMDGNGFSDLEFNAAAASDQAITVYPYSNSKSIISGTMQVVAQTFGITSATTAAIAGLLQAAQDGNQINVVTFSGGAAAFTAGIQWLNSNGYSNVTNLIGNITYVSPGIVGTVYTNSSTSVLLGGGLSPDSLATALANVGGANSIQIAQACGHDFGCIVGYYRSLLPSGTPCSNPITIKQPPNTASFMNLFPNDSAPAYDPVAYLNWVWDHMVDVPPPQFAVQSNIKYNLQ